LNRNGRYDAATEPLVRTNAQGIALFPNLFPATYSVLEVFDPSVPNDFQIATGPNPVSFNVPGPNTTPSVPLPTATPPLPARAASSIDELTGGTDMAATVSIDPLTNGGSSAAVVTASSADSLLAPETAGVMNFDFNKLKEAANSQIAFFMAEQGFDKPDLLLGAPTSTPLF